MVEQSINRRYERAERETIPRRKRWRGGPIFGACTIITGAERNRYKLCWVTRGNPCRKTNFNRLAAWVMNSLQVRWQGGCIVCDDEVARTEERCECSTWQMPHHTVSIHDKQLG